MEEIQDISAKRKGAREIRARDGGYTENSRPLE